MMTPGRSSGPRGGGSSGGSSGGRFSSSRSGGRGGRGAAAKKGKFARTKKKKFVKKSERVLPNIDFKDTALLARFLTDKGKILPRRVTRLRAQDQRTLARAVKRAREISLIPSVR